MGLGRTFSVVLRKEGTTFRTALLTYPSSLQNTNESDYNYDFDSDLETQLKKVSTKNELGSLILFSSLRCAEVEIVFPDVGFHQLSQNFLLDQYTQSEWHWPTDSEEPDSTQITSTDKTTKRQYHEVS